MLRVNVQQQYIAKYLNPLKIEKTKSGCLLPTQFSTFLLMMAWFYLRLGQFPSTTSRICSLTHIYATSSRNLKTTFDNRNGRIANPAMMVTIAHAVLWPGQFYNAIASLVQTQTNEILSGSILLRENTGDLSRSVVKDSVVYISVV